VYFSNKRWGSNNLRTPQTRVHPLLHPPAALRSKVADRGSIYDWRQDLHDALRKCAFLGLKVFAPVSHARRGNPEHLGRRRGQAHALNFGSERLGNIQVFHSRTIGGTADNAEDKSVIVVLHRARALDCCLNHRLTTLA